MPAKENFFSRLTGNVRQKMNTFLYGENGSGYGGGSGAMPMYGDDEAPYEPERKSRRRRSQQYREEAYAQPEGDPMTDPQAAQQAYAQQAWQQQGYAQQQMNYGYPPQQPVQQQPMGGYQPPLTQFAAQMEEQRARGAQPQQPQQEQPKVVPFPGSYNGEQAPDGKPASVRVITIRGFNDCRSAISYLRAGEILLVVMDGVQDQAEMRRYVDMMAGACFSLSASITKVSRYGSYLAAPSQVSVWADPAVSQMNNSGRRTAPAGYQSSYRGYPGQQPYAAAQGYAESQQGGAYAQPEFYARQPQPVPEQPPFEAQERGAGYAPDHEDPAAAL